MTTRTKDLFPKQPNVALISIRPHFVDKILSGEKRLEFRRSWATKPVDVLIIYSSAPIQRIVAKVNIVRVTEGSPTALWALAKEKGGGVTRQLIYDYFAGKKSGFAIEIAEVLKFEHPLDPKTMFKNFLAPQSFRYLDAKDYNKILEKSWGGGRMNVILVAGIHAVGKSTACKAISAEFGIPYYTASQIIQAEKSSAVLGNSKLVADVDKNQRLLIQGISRLVKRGGLLLDGHFTLQRKSDGGIEAVQVDVFRELQVSAVVVFTDDPAEIAKRMLARDGVTQSEAFLQTHQEAEVAHAKHVAAMLEVPLVILQAFDTKRFENAIRDWGFKTQKSNS